METDIKDYWYTHHDITIPDCNNIDWQSSRWVAKGLPVNKQRLFHNFQSAILVIAITGKKSRFFKVFKLPGKKSVTTVSKENFKKKSDDDDGGFQQQIPQRFIDR